MLHEFQCEGDSASHQYYLVNQTRKKPPFVRELDKSCGRKREFSSESLACLGAQRKPRGARRTDRPTSVLNPILPSHHGAQKTWTRRSKLPARCSPREPLCIGPCDLRVGAFIVGDKCWHVMAANSPTLAQVLTCLEVVRNGTVGFHPSRRCFVSAFEPISSENHLRSCMR